MAHIFIISRMIQGHPMTVFWEISGYNALLTVLYFSLVPYFPACLDFPSPPLSAPGSPRMVENGRAPLRYARTEIPFFFFNFSFCLFVCFFYFGFFLERGRGAWGDWEISFCFYFLCFKVRLGQEWETLYRKQKSLPQINSESLKRKW